MQANEVGREAENLWRVWIAGSLTPLRWLARGLQYLSAASRYATQRPMTLCYIDKTGVFRAQKASPGGVLLPS
jgi:hypothetical protein